ncbi:MAG: Hsp70 family protein [Bryobacteraceae bacterium]|nr:Hsp70 family protein [Bryobacteraceae bacterium]
MNVGIDLGTTNSALAYIDPAEAMDADFPPIHVLEIPQTVAPGRVEPRRTLPSFLYLDQNETHAGAYAREQGALAPTRSVYAAKSWLSNAEVDRTAKILPWDAPESGRLFSPVEVSAKYLSQIAAAWQAKFGTPVSDADVVLTVPASFDEEARALTVQAAHEAGLGTGTGKLTLIEEPAAAFYSWIANHLAQSRKSLVDGMNVLVCDVGGGTSDFTLIRVNRDGDRVEFTRTAVGKHLLLGGDNLDLTLAWLVESKLAESSKAQLSLRQRSALRRQCAAAKEKLLASETLASVEITVLGGGTSLIGGTLKTQLLREEALELALDGFLPFCALSDKPQDEKRSVFRELGLPYVSDPAVTKHLAAFLESAHTAPDAILFNGGFFIPALLRERVAKVVESWYGRAPAILENQDLDLAVSVGAAYYSHVRATGQGVVVRGGLPRTYYIGLNDGRAVCLVPRGSEEGSTLALDRDGLSLIANKPVSFRLYSSLTRIDDAPGAVIDLPEDVHEHAPLDAVIRFGKPTEQRLIPVKLGARLSEVGTLETWADSKISEHRWRLEFQLRKAREAAASRPAAVVADEALAAAEQKIRGVFQGDGAPEALPAQLEQTLGLGRGAWPLSAIRRLADVFLECAKGRERSAQHELRWLNLAGLCLRPGFGYPGDDLRIEQARRVYAGGLAFPSAVQNESEWWIFWGRVAGGLNRNQQADIYQRLSGYLGARGKKTVRVNSSLLREMFRCASSLELLPNGVKTDLGETLVKGVAASDRQASDLWCLSRIGARQLFYGPNNQVLPPATVERWIGAIAKLSRAEDALVAMARVTGDAARDVSPATLALVKRTLGDQAERLEKAEADFGRVFGEELPSGLVIAPRTAADDE